MSDCNNNNCENCEEKHGEDDANLYHWYGAPVRPNVTIALVVLAVVIIGGLIATWIW